MTAFPVGTVAAPSRRGEPGERVWRVAAVVAVAVAALVSAKVAFSAVGPAFPYDEIDQLQMSRLLAGFDVSEVRGAGYYPAWSFLLAPIWWFTSDALTMYRTAIAIGLVLGLAAIAPLALLARRLRLTTPQAVVAAAVVVTLPAVALQSDYALSERMLLLAVSVMVLAAWRLWERPSLLRAVAFTAMVGVVYFTHVRVAAAVLASAVWLLLFALRNWRIALVGLVSLAVFALAAQHFGSALNVELIGQFSQGDSLTDTLTTTRAGLLLRSGLGQAWTQIVGTLGVAAVGLVSLAVWAWREVRRFRAGRATYLLAIVVAMYLLTTVKWASDYHLFTRPWHRLDTWLYGRYIDPFTSLVVLVGVAVIIRGARRRVLVAAGAVSLAVILPTVLWVARDAPTWGYVTPAHIPGVTPWYWLLPGSPFPDGTRLVPAPWNENRFWVYASLTAIVALALIYVFRRFRKSLAVGLLLAAALMSVVGDGASDRFRDLEYTPPAALPELMQALEATGPVDAQFDKGCNPDGAYESVTINFYGFWLAPTVLSTYDSTTGTPSADLLILCEGEEPDGRDDAVVLPGSEYRGTMVWVAEGPLAAELERLDALP